MELHDCFLGEDVIKGFIKMDLSTRIIYKKKLDIMDISFKAFRRLGYLHEYNNNEHV